MTDISSNPSSTYRDYLDRNSDGIFFRYNDTGLWGAPQTGGPAPGAVSPTSQAGGSTPSSGPAPSINPQALGMLSMLDAGAAGINGQAGQGMIVGISPVTGIGIGNIGNAISSGNPAAIAAVGLNALSGLMGIGPTGIVGLGAMALEGLMGPGALSNLAISNMMSTNNVAHDVGLAIAAAEAQGAGTGPGGSAGGTGNSADQGSTDTGATTGTVGNVGGGPGNGVAWRRGGRIDYERFKDGGRVEDLMRMYAPIRRKTVAPDWNSHPVYRYELDGVPTEELMRPRPYRGELDNVPVEELMRPPVQRFKDGGQAYQKMSADYPFTNLSEALVISTGVPGWRHLQDSAHEYVRKMMPLHFPGMPEDEYPELARQTYKSRRRAHDSYVDRYGEYEGFKKGRKVEAPAVRSSDASELEGLSRPLIGPVYNNKFPGIWDDPRLIAERANAQVGPESDSMMRLFGHNRQSLYEQFKDAVGNVDGASVIRLSKNPRDNSPGAIAANNIMTPGNAQRLIDIQVEAMKYPGLIHGPQVWYRMDPLWEKLRQRYGDELADKYYRRLNTYTSLASPESPVHLELERGLAANSFAERGMFDQYRRFMSLPESKRRKNFPPELEYVRPAAHPSSTLIGMQKFHDNDFVDTSKVKVPLYMWASGVPSLGFQTNWAVPDAHYSRGVGLADVRQSADPNIAMSGTEGRLVLPWYKQNVTDPLGIEAVPGQARQWTILGPATGVKTMLGAPKLELLSDHVMKRAYELGINPEDMLMQIATGRRHAAGGYVNDDGNSSQMQILGRFLDDRSQQLDS